MRFLVAPAALSVAGAALYVTLRPYALARVRGFLDPWRYSQAEGFQLVQSFVAFGRGELLGVGLGDGRQKLFYLPEAHTDFILSVVAEELGLAGVLRRARRLRRLHRGRRPGSHAGRAIRSRCSPPSG